MKSTTCSLLIALFFLCDPSLRARQSGTRAEDAASSASSPSGATFVGGYGNSRYQWDNNAAMGTIDLERVVLFVGHRFAPSVSFFSELEVEDAKVSGGEQGGEIAFEQAYLRFTLDRNTALAAGLFLPRIGILNENHLPTDFHGNERTQVETWIIPSTWRELGVGLFASLTPAPVHVSLALVNGLNSSAFRHGTGIREGRFEGRTATANNLAVTGSIQFIGSGWTGQLSGYYGGTVGASKSQADSLGLAGGLFGTAVALGEAHVQYEESGVRLRLLGVVVSIPDAFSINRAYGSNTPALEYGAYGEAAYNILESSRRKDSPALYLFARYERLDLNSTIPANGVFDGSLRQDHVIAGVEFLPIPNAAVKGDVRFRRTAATSNPNALFLNVGVAYSF